MQEPTVHVHLPEAERSPSASYAGVENAVDMPGLPAACQSATPATSRSSKTGIFAMLQPVCFPFAGGQLHALASSAVIGMHGQMGAAAALRLEMPARMPGTACLQLVQRDCTEHSSPHSCQWPVSGPCREHPPS